MIEIDEKIAIMIDEDPEKAKAIAELYSEESGDIILKAISLMTPDENRWVSIGENLMELDHPSWQANMGKLMKLNLDAEKHKRVK